MLSSAFSFEENAVVKDLKVRMFSVLDLLMLLETPLMEICCPLPQDYRHKGPLCSICGAGGGEHLPTSGLAFMSLAPSLVLHVFKRKLVLLVPKLQPLHHLLHSSLLVQTFLYQTGVTAGMRKHQSYWLCNPVLNALASAKILYYLTQNFPQGFPSHGNQIFSSTQNIFTCGFTARGEVCILEKKKWRKVPHLEPLLPRV